MNEQDYLKGRIRDLWRRACREDYLTHSRFLGLSEQAIVRETLLEEGAPRNPGKNGDGPFWLLEGGTAEDDRRLLLCCPYWMEEPVPLEEIITCLQVVPRNARFTDHPSHRDYLGALMHLGITREQIGEIYAGEDGAYLFAMKEMEEMICRELHSVRHTAVEVKPVSASSCEAVRRTREIAGTIASERIDSIVAMAFHLSRGQAQDLLAAERVFADGRIPSGASYTPAPGERISVRGYGKFVYLGTKGTTRKGRLGAVVRMFV